MKRDESALLDIHRAAQLAQQFAEQCEGKEAFLQDVMIQSAVLHQMMILGEATKRLSDDFREAHPEIPWRKMAGMRDVFIHGYDEVDLDEVWQIIDREVPHLLEQLEPLLPDEPQ